MQGQSQTVTFHPCIPKLILSLFFVSLPPEKIAEDKKRKGDSL